MADEREVRPGFLPPAAPGGPPAAGPPAAPAPGWSPPAVPSPWRASSADGPTFVKDAPGSGGPSSRLAVVSMVLGGLSIGFGVITLGLAFLITIPLALAALALALSSRRDRGRRPGQVRAAMVIAVIAVVLALLAAAVWTALDASGFGPEDLQRWLEDELERQRQRQERRDGPGELSMAD